VHCARLGRRARAQEAGPAWQASGTSSAPLGPRRGPPSGPPWRAWAEPPSRHAPFGSVHSGFFFYQVLFSVFPLPVPTRTPLEATSTIHGQHFQLTGVPAGTVSLRLYRPTTPPLPNPLARHSLLAAARRENWSVAFPGTSRSSRRATSPSRATRRGCGGGCIRRSCDYIGGADRKM
jgi:hypothetical protein